MSKNKIHKILALVPYPVDGPSSRYRVHQFIKPLSNLGIDVLVHSIMTPSVYRTRMKGKKISFNGYLSLIYKILSRVLLVSFSKPDAIILHREFMPVMRTAAHWFFSKIVRSPVIYDFDDAVFTEFQIDNLIRVATATTPGNQFLANYVASINPDIHIQVIPTVVDINYYQPNINNTNVLELIAGWIGTESSYKRYMAPRLRFLVEIVKRFNAVVHVVGPITIQNDVESKGANFFEWSLATERDLMGAFHIGFMPLFDDRYTKGKCAFKIVEYGAYGIPSVASSVGANIDVVVQGETGFLVESDQDWEEALQKLLTNPELRASMGAKARNRIVARYSLQSQVVVWADLIRTVVAENKLKLSKGGRS
jgi:glycosyltransferase involved in cell wall biosynthesis